MTSTNYFQGLNDYVELREESTKAGTHLVGRIPPLRLWGLTPCWTWCCFSSTDGRGICGVDLDWQWPMFVGPRLLGKN